MRKWQLKVHSLPFVYVVLANRTAADIRDMNIAIESCITTSHDSTASPLATLSDNRNDEMNKIVLSWSCDLSMSAPMRQSTFMSNKAAFVSRLIWLQSDEGVGVFKHFWEVLLISFNETNMNECSFKVMRLRHQKEVQSYLNHAKWCLPFDPDTW